MASSYVLFIDESGDEGFKFTSGSSEWFVLGAVLIQKKIELETLKLVDTVRNKIRMAGRAPLHFKDLRHDRRIPYVDEISQASVKAFGVLVHKPSLTSPQVFAQRYKLYFFATRMLLERVSWFCRDNPCEGDGTIEIVFSNRSSLSYTEICEYLELLQLQQATGSDIRIDFSVIAVEKITAAQARDRMGLQIADAIASSFFASINKNRYGYTENRYIRILKPVVYERNRSYFGYGIKAFPNNAPLEELRSIFGG